MIDYLKKLKYQELQEVNKKIIEQEVKITNNLTPLEQVQRTIWDISARNEALLTLLFSKGIITELDYLVALKIAKQTIKEWREYAEKIRRGC